MCTPQLPEEVWTVLFSFLSLSDKLSLRLTCKHFRDLVDTHLRTPWLPEEVWTALLSFLSLSDKLSLRLTCTYFRDLVDTHLWKNRFFELKNSMRRGEESDEHLWNALRRWRVTSVLMSYSDARTHKVTEEVPELTTLIINGKEEARMNKPDLPAELDLRHFTNLEQLYIRYALRVIDLEQMAVLMPQSLTHLSVCSHVDFTHILPAEIPENSVFKNLKTLHFHCVFNYHPVMALHFFLSSLPGLQHISLLGLSDARFVLNVSDLPPLNHRCLSSLELTQCVPQHLPSDLMKMFRSFPVLRHLTLEFSWGASTLVKGLEDLPALTSLTLISDSVSELVRSIPRGLTRLSLCLSEIYDEDIFVLSAMLPNLRHLSLLKKSTDLRTHERCSHPAALIPQLFPRLKTLCLQFRRACSNEDQVPDEAFLSLASLKELEVLEILDEELPPAALLSTFRALTNNRVQIYCRPEAPVENRLKSCTCDSKLFKSHRWPHRF